MKKTIYNFFSKLALNNYERGSTRAFGFSDIVLEIDRHDYKGHSSYFGSIDLCQNSLIEPANEDDIILCIGSDGDNLSLNRNTAKQVIEFSKSMGYRVTEARTKNCIDSTQSFENGHLNFMVPK